MKRGMTIEYLKCRKKFCEECVLPAYENSLGRIAKIKSSIKKQQKVETRDQNSDTDHDQTGLKDLSAGNGPKNKVLTENKNKFPPKPQGAQPNGNRSTSQKNGDVDNDDNKNKTVCRYYSAGKCQHGRVGSDCRYSHPKMCRKYIKNGYNIHNGCTRAANCNFFHPKLCHNSVAFFQCDKVYCNYYHLVKFFWEGGLPLNIFLGLIFFRVGLRYFRGGGD